MSLLTRSCYMPGCGRTLATWKTKGRKGRQPVHWASINKQWRELCCGEVPTKYVRVCDIHFTVHDFFPRYLKSRKEPRPPHLACAKKKKDAIPSLFLNKEENMLAQKEALKIGEPDWWRLCSSYDETLDLDNLLEFNTSSYCRMIQHKLSLSQEQTSTEVDACTVPAQHGNEAKEHWENIRVPIWLKDLHIKTEPCWVSVQPEAQKSHPRRMVDTSKHMDDTYREVERKKLQLFRLFCTSPLMLPNNWGVHSYVDDNYLIISKETFSEEEGFMVERAVRVTSTLDFLDIQCKGKNISNFMQEYPLNSIAELEKLIEEVNLW